MLGPLQHLMESELTRRILRAVPLLSHLTEATHAFLTLTPTLTRTLTLTLTLPLPLPLTLTLT